MSCLVKIGCKADISLAANRQKDHPNRRKKTMTHFLSRQSSSKVTSGPSGTLDAKFREIFSEASPSVTDGIFDISVLILKQMSVSAGCCDVS